MLFWSRDVDLLMAGAAAHEMRHELSMSHMLGDWPERTLKRVKTAKGLAAWCWVNKQGRLSVMAIAPWGDVWDQDYVGDVEFFALRMPKTWDVKPHMEAKPRDPSHGYGAGWAIGKRADHSVMLCKVGAHDGPDKLISVILHDDLDAVPVEDVKEITRWWPLGQHAEGLAALWDKGVRSAHNYRLLTMMAGRAAKVAAGIKLTRRKKGDAAPAPGTVDPDKAPDDGSRFGQMHYAGRLPD